MWHNHKRRWPTPPCAVQAGRAMIGGRRSGRHAASGAAVRGWVQAMATLGADNVPKAELIRRYGAALRADCRAAGFEPHCDIPIRQQSPEAQRAAATWARHLLDEHTYLTMAIARDRDVVPVTLADLLAELREIRRLLEDRQRPRVGAARIGAAGAGVAGDWRDVRVGVVPGDASSAPRPRPRCGWCSADLNARQIGRLLRRGADHAMTST